MLHCIYEIQSRKHTNDQSNIKTPNILKSEIIQLKCEEKLALPSAKDKTKRKIFINNQITYILIR